MSAEVHVEERRGLGILTLDRPKALNALTRDMVGAVSAALARWRLDPAIRAVLIKAAPGRAFCAGGDIRAAIEAVRDHDVEAAVPFFFDEYRMNWRIGRLGKPFVALLDGITMGGGVGISVHGSHRIATENTLFAMPETGIGFFPDVGGSHFLPRLPRRSGCYLGLTGVRLDGATTTRLGIATHYLPSARCLDLEAALLDGMTIDAALAELAGEPGPASLDLGLIERLFAAPDLTSLLVGLAEDGGTFAAETLATLRSKSPLSVAVTFAELQRGAGLDLADCLAMEYRMVHRFLADSDFAEGVRAQIVDKDRNPRWRHAAIEEVPPAAVETFFAPLPAGDLVFDWNG